MKGLYYFVKRIYQLSQSLPIFEKLGGRIINILEFPTTYLFYSFKYGFNHTKLFLNNLKGLNSFVNGLILCHSADDTVPSGDRYKRVFVYHGTSDKVFTMEDKKINIDWFEYYFLTGPKDLYKLKKFSHNSEKLDSRIVKIGMFRSDAIIKKLYNKEEILKKYGINSDGKKIILYAPTWEWGGGTLRECFDTFAKRITNDFILIVRPHTNDRKNIFYIRKWQRKNKVKNLYIFSRQSQDIMELIYIADLFIGDNSAVNYDFAITKRPMILIKSESDDTFVPPEEYNIKSCVPIYEHGKDDIIAKIEDAFTNKNYIKNIDELVKNSFYFNDGHAIDRACSFIVDKLDQMSILDKKEVVEKYRDVFTYTKSYL